MLMGLREPAVESQAWLPANLADPAVYAWSSLFRSIATGVLTRGEKRCILAIVEPPSVFLPYVCHR